MNWLSYLSTGMWVFANLMPTLIQNSKRRDTPIGTKEYIGWGLWALGFLLQVVADRQKSAFRADPANAVRHWVLQRNCFWKNSVLISLRFQTYKSGGRIYGATNASWSRFWVIRIRIYLASCSWCGLSRIYFIIVSKFWAIGTCDKDECHNTSGGNLKVEGPAKCHWDQLRFMPRLPFHGKVWLKGWAD